MANHFWKIFYKNYMDKYLDKEIKIRLLNYLSTFATDNRLLKFEEIISQRTKYVTVVLENIFQSHNASAVLRTCDCFGIQDVHIIENENHFNVNSDIALGSSKWLNVYKYSQKQNASKICLENLKNKGYAIVATSLHEKALKLEDVPVDKKIAVIFGTELNGLTKETLQNADYTMKIPMYGFTESLNISVSVAIAMFYFTNKIREKSSDYFLTEEEKVDVMLNWMRNSINKCELIEKKFLSEL
mgnify:CR=1 FL=1